MNTTRTLMTADELFALPDDGLRHELIDGELQTMTPAGGEHGWIAAKLARIVGNFVDSSSLGDIFGAETGFRIRTDPDTVRAPDLAFVRRDRIPPGGIPEPFWAGAPALAAEIVSPGDRYTAVDQKVAEWLAAGVEQVWVINPRRRTVAVHSADGIVLLSETDDLTGGEVLPGLSCRVAELFP